jgi:hypothetical protein
MRTRKDEVVNDPERDESQGSYKTLNYVEGLPWFSCIGKVCIVRVWWGDVTHVWWGTSSGRLGHHSTYPSNSNRTLTSVLGD